MSNCYTNTCFTFRIARDEYVLLVEAIALAQFLEDQPEDAAIAAFWRDCSEGLRALFPSEDDDPVSGFLAIFSDCDFPTFGTTFTFSEECDDAVSVLASADQFEPDAVAMLLQRTITRSLPIMATWSYDSDRPSPDAFGGGGFQIDAGGIHWIETSKVHDNTHFAPRLVISMRDSDEGLLFWNSNEGFDSLESADVFTEKQALETDLPIAHGQPEWLALPAALSD